VFAALKRSLDRLEEILIAVLLVGMVLMTFSQVITRYGFNAGWVWSLEATTYMFGGLLMVGISFAMRQHAHMNVDVLVQALPRRWKRAATLLAIALCFTYVALMLWGAFELVARLHDLGSNARDLPAKRWVLMCMLPAGFSLLGLRLVQVTAEVLRGQRDSLGDAHGHARETAPPPAGEAAP
jgi:C4-dicarboxylate transporter DctQ subunit